MEFHCCIPEGARLCIEERHLENLLIKCAASSVITLEPSYAGSDMELSDLQSDEAPQVGCGPYLENQRGQRKKCGSWSQIFLGSTPADMVSVYCPCASVPSCMFIMGIMTSAFPPVSTQYE